ncbi:DUF5693 family protein [Helicovermis profundi]|uniref:Uncharacterized protein n=1 Tax=Helicovermis profundi TaxID=3065157 RepID=A0AAU9E1D5_9FIRM|nr:hypothetical protein HLPR_06000 [Clostridia bacterium S502]
MRKKAIYIVLILISLFAVGYSLFNRVGIESSGKSVEIDLDYYEMNKLSEQSSKPIEYWFKEFKKMGVYGVALEEESINNLVKYDKNINYILANNVIKDTKRYKDYPLELNNLIDSGKVDKYDLIVNTSSSKMNSFIIEGLKNRYPKDFYKTFYDGIYYIVLDGTFKDAEYGEKKVYLDYEGKRIGNPLELVSSKLTEIGIGFDKDKIDKIQSSGLKVISRPINYTRYPSKLIDAYKNEIDKYDINPGNLIFAGSSVLGYSKSSKNDTELIEFMDKYKIHPALIETSVQRENIEQDGINKLVKDMNYQAVRVFPILNYIQKRYKFYNYQGAEEIENTMYRAITERNIRVVYFRPFLKNDTEYVSNLSDYKSTFKNLESRLKEHNIVYSNASVYKYRATNILLISLISIGLIAFSLILLKLVFKISERLELILLTIGLLLIYPALYIAPNLSMHIFALLSSVVFPSLAIVILLEFSKDRIIDNKFYKMKEIYFNSLVMLFITVSLAMLGGFYVASILMSSRFLLEMEIFRGVKASQLSPFIVLIIAYIVKFGFKRSEKDLLSASSFVSDISKMLNEKIKVIYIIVGSIVAIIGYIYIARTGHETNIQPSNLEMIFRNLLEVKLIVRPRSKEMLLAFPSIIVLVYFALRKYKKLVFPLSLAVVVGYASVANTFSHIRTPFYLSFLRTIYGMFFGAIIGIVVISIINLILILITKIKEKKIYD